MITVIFWNLMNQIIVIMGLYYWALETRFSRLTKFSETKIISVI